MNAMPFCRVLRGDSNPGWDSTVLTAPAQRIAIWQRETPPAPPAALQHLADHAPFCAVAEAEPEALPALLAAQLPCAMPAGLRADIAMLAAHFALVAGVATLRARLEAFQGPGCHRWHADAVPLRLLCTYVGPGTEWLDLAGGARTARGLRDVAPPVPPQALRPFDVALLRGEAHAAAPGQGCIHRSPPCAEADPPRLLLCFDEPGRIPLP